MALVRRARLRETALRNASGEWDFDAIFNRELYPAIKALILDVTAVSQFPPVFLTGASNSIVPDHEHKNLLVSHIEPTLLAMSEANSRLFPLGAVILIGQDGVGQVELSPEGTVSILSSQTLKLAGQNSQAILVKTGDLEWRLFGDIEAIPVNVALLIQDRFIGGALSVTGTNADANVGQLQWNTVRDSQDGTVTRVASQSDHPGIVRLTGHPTLGSRQSMYLGHAAVSGSVVQFDEVAFMEFTVRNVQNRFRFGVGDDAAAAGFGNNRIVIGSDADISAVWVVGVANAGVATTVTTTVPITNNWIVWRIEFISSAELRFFADEVLIATITTNVPSFSALMAPSLQVVTVTPGPFQGIGEIDLFTMQMKTA